MICRAIFSNIIIILNMDTPPSPTTFEFTVEVRGEKYDVYWFEKNGKIGQLAFKPATSKPGIEWEIVLFRAGRKTHDEVRSEIVALFS